MNERETTCRTYFSLAKKKNSEPRGGLNNQFFAEGLREIWTAFDAYLAWKFPAEHNRKMQEDYAKAYQEKFSSWPKSDKYTKSIDQLEKLVPVKDMSPITSRKDATLDDKYDLDEILYLLYRIRSNLDHGAKNLEGDTENAERNRQLVEYGFFVTYEILERTLIEGKIIT